MKYFNTVAGKIYNISSGSYLSKILPLQSSDSDDIKRYFSGQYITDGMYADAKAAFYALKMGKSY